MTALNFHSDGHRGTPVDVFATEPLDFDQEFGETIVGEVASDVPVPILCLAALVKLKREAGLTQDLADIDELALSMESSAMREEEIDWSLTTWGGNRRQQRKDFQAPFFSRASQGHRATARSGRRLRGTPPRARAARAP